MGESIRLNGVLFTVVGVLAPKMQEGAQSDRNRQIYVPFSTMSDIKDTKYLDGIWFSYQGDPRWWKKRCGRRWLRRITSGRQITTPFMLPIC